MFQVNSMYAVQILPHDVDTAVPAYNDLAESDNPPISM